MAKYPSWRCQMCGDMLNEGEQGFCEECKDFSTLSKKEEQAYARAIEEGQIEIAFEEENRATDPRNENNGSKPSG